VQLAYGHSEQGRHSVQLGDVKGDEPDQATRDGLPSGAQGLSYGALRNALAGKLGSDTRGYTLSVLVAHVAGHYTLTARPQGAIMVSLGVN